MAEDAASGGRAPADRRSGERGSAPSGEERPRASRLKRIGLAAVMAVVALNVWTGSPLLGLWVGSRVQGDGPPSMAAIFAVAATIAVASVLLVMILGRLQAAYDAATGHVQVQRHVPWLRSMRGEREQYPDTQPRLSTLDRILVLMVVVVVVIFEIWFFFFSTSPIDTRSGRSQAEPPAQQVALDSAPRDLPPAIRSDLPLTFR